MQGVVARRAQLGGASSSSTDELLLGLATTTGQRTVESQRITLVTNQGLFKSAEAQSRCRLHKVQIVAHLHPLVAWVLYMLNFCDRLNFTYFVS